MSERDGDERRHLVEKEEHELVTSRREREDAERDNLLKMLHSDIERLNAER